LGVDVAGYRWLRLRAAHHRDHRRNGSRWWRPWRPCR
jgi:hypothetical protein